MPDAKSIRISLSLRKLGSWMRGTLSPGDYVFPEYATLFEV